MKSKFTTIIITIVTIILAGVAMFTARQLYNTRDQAIAPNAPSSKPFAQELPTDDPNACALSFTLSTSTPTPSPTASPTASPVSLCNSACSTTSDCPSGLSCYIPSGATGGNCRNTSCTSATNCTCATATPTPTPTPTRTPSPTPVITASPTPVVTATPVPQCNSVCTTNSQCMTGTVCYIPSGQTSGNCRNTQCLSETDCTCAVVTVTTPPAEPTLPEVGTKWPTVVGSVFGILVILGSLLLAF